jgi:hypothetical protein
MRIVPVLFASLVVAAGGHALAQGADTPAATPGRQVAVQAAPPAAAPAASTAPPPYRPARPPCSTAPRACSATATRWS